MNDPRKNNPFVRDLFVEWANNRECAIPFIPAETPDHRDLWKANYSECAVHVGAAGKKLIAAAVDYYGVGVIWEESNGSWHFSTGTLSEFLVPVLLEKLASMRQAVVDCLECPRTTDGYSDGGSLYTGAEMWGFHKAHTSLAKR